MDVFGASGTKLVQLLTLWSVCLQMCSVLCALQGTVVASQMLATVGGARLGLGVTMFY